MNVQSLGFSHFLNAYSSAKDSAKQAIAILDIVKQAQKEAKEDAIREIRPHDLATKADLKALEQTTKLDLTDTKVSLIKWMAGIILVGVWAPLLVGLVIKFAV